MSTLENFKANNSELDLIEADLNDPQVVKQLNWAGAVQAVVIPQLKALQRVQRVAPDPAHAQALLDKGFDSAHKITSVSKQHFVDQMGGPLGPDGEQLAAKIYEAAEQRTNQVMNVWGLVNHLSAPHFNALRANAIHPDVNEYFQGMPGYQDFFGSLNYCDCSECKSIFGPAAYFVDLLRIIDKKVTQQNPDSVPHLMGLDDRRPDLKQIKLTCEKTTHTFPYINIVNERLEHSLSAQGTGNDLYQKVAQLYFPFSLPFHLPLTKIRVILAQLKTSLSDILRWLRADAALVAAELIPVSPEEWALLTTTNAKTADLQNFYGVTDLSQLNTLDTFCARTGLTILQVQDLLNQNLSGQELTAHLDLGFFINENQSNAPSTLEGQIRNFNPAVLDRVHRFVRLANKLSWSFADLNWAIHAIHKNWAIHAIHKGPGDIDAPTLTEIAGIQELSQQYKLKVSDLLAFIYDLKTIGVGKDATVSEAPFDQVFNGAGQAVYHPIYAGNPLVYTDPVKPSWDSTQTDAANQKRSAWVAAGTGLRENDLKILVEAFFQGTLKLTVEDLSTVYRHARLSKQLQMRVTDYLLFRQLFSFTSATHSVEELRKIFLTRELLKRSGLNVYQLNYVVNDQDSPYVRRPYQPDQLANWFDTLHRLIKPNEPKNAKSLKLLTQLSSLLHTDEKTVTALLCVLSLQVDQVTDVFLTDVKAATEVIEHLSRGLVITVQLKLTLNDLETIAANAKNYFASRPRPTADEVLELFLFKEAQGILDDESEALLDYMSAADTTHSATVLAGFLPIEAGQIKTLLDNLSGATRIAALRSVMQIADISSSTGAGVSVLRSLKDLAGKGASTDWDSYTEMADNLVAIARARHSAEDWTQLFSRIDGEVQAKLRTALVATALIQLQTTPETAWIKTERNLYEYLLIDVEMGGCAQISYIKEGLNALQLYLHRCRERLEPGIDNLPIPDEWWEWIVNYRIWEANRKIFLYPENYLDPSIRKSKTTAFKNFENSLNQGSLDPENIEIAFRKYLEEFSELAHLVYVDAYYLDSRDVLPGCSSLADGPASSIIFFARTKDEPYKYYHITWQAGPSVSEDHSGIWSEWKEVNIPIHAKHITPVFAFDRLFLFWVEQTTRKDVDEQSDKNAKITVVKATVKYSFHNFGKNWVQPQTLVPETVISVSGALAPKGQYPPDFFDTTRLIWNKVYCLTIKPGQYNSLSRGANKAEKLIVLLGPVLNTEDSPGGWGNSTDSTETNVDLKELEGWLHQTAANFQKIKHFSYRGNLPAFPPTVIESDLRPNFLLNPDEFVFLQRDDTTVVNYFRESNDRASGLLNLVATDQVVIDNYDVAQTEVPATSDASTPWVSGEMRNSNYIVFPIANHPAAFVFQGERESFLMLDPTKAMPSISRMVFNPDTLFTKSSFIPGVGNARDSEAAFNLLVSAGILLPNGRLSPGTNERDLFECKPWPGLVVINPIAKKPVFTQTSFVGINISADDSGNVLRQLKLTGNLVDDGRLWVTKNLFDLSLDLQPLNLNEQQIRFIANVLRQSMYPTSIGLIQDNKAADIGQYQFQATRLTTAAIHRLSSAVFVGGVDKLLGLPMQQIPVEPRLPYGRFSFNSASVNPPVASDGAEVDFDGPYGLYYWELFFHAPHLIFNMLKGRQTFDQAEKWMKYIFNPTAPAVKIGEQSFVTSTLGLNDSIGIFKILKDQNLVTDDGQVADSVNRSTDLTSYFAYTPDQIASILNVLLNQKLSKPVSRYWQFRPFRNHTLETMKEQLSDQNAINAYHCHPFDPHAIARLRIGAYEKASVMQYIDNLLDWGDMQFRRYTWESITTATLYYVYAWNLLGPRPQSVGDCTSAQPKSYQEISDAYQKEIPEFLIQLETVTPQHTVALPTIPYNELDTYFCVPENADFVAYWDRVEDRLFKIRHCLNIDGQPVPLALFEPPIDPMALARAAAAGADVLSIFGGGGGIDNYYRFSVLLDRARAFTSSVVQFGGTLLDALEKKDAAALDRLRSTQEKAILNLSTRNFEQQIEEQKSLIESVTQQKTIAENRKQRYQKLIDAGWSGNEKANIALLSLSEVPVTLSALCIQIAGPMKLFPNIFGLADGGNEFWAPVEAAATALEQDGKVLETGAEIAAKVAEMDRRSEEWEFEKNEAEEEVERIEKEIAAAEVRQKILEGQLKIHEKTIAQAEEYETFLKAKFTGQDLYQWMISRVATIHNQAYHLALDLALKAQAAYQFELSSDDTFIEFDYWDSIHKGLLAGEGLTLSLNQMEAAYLQKNVPLMELEKEISLLHLDPEKFMEFKMGINGATKGTLNFSLTQALFDGDFPGHYNRKIKAVSLTFLGAGLKGNAINATLLQTKNTVVLTKDSADPVGYLVNKNPASPPDGTIRPNWLASQSVALSKKTNDAGLFVLDFRYPDDQFYPFEGTGAVSEWTLTVPPENNRLDFNAISDIVVNLRYTSLDGGEPYATNVKAVYAKPPSSEVYPQPLAKVIDVKQTLGVEKWEAFVSTPTAKSQYVLELPLADGAIITNTADVTLVSADVVLNTTKAVSDKDSKNSFLELAVGGASQKVKITKSVGTADLGRAAPTGDKITLALDKNSLPDDLKSGDKLKPDVLKLQNVFVAVRFESAAM